MAVSMVGTDLQSAVAWLNQLPAGQLRDAAQETSSRLRGLQSDPQAALAWTHRVHSSMAKNAALQSIATTLGQSDPPGRPWRWSQSLPSSSARNNVQQQIISAWAQDDPKAAGDYVSGLPNNGQKTNLMRNIVRPAGANGHAGRACPGPVDAHVQCGEKRRRAARHSDLGPIYEFPSRCRGPMSNQGLAGGEARRDDVRLSTIISEHGELGCPRRPGHDQANWRRARPGTPPSSRLLPSGAGAIPRRPWLTGRPCPPARRASNFMRGGRLANVQRTTRPWRRTCSRKLPDDDGEKSQIISNVAGNGGRRTISPPPRPTPPPCRRVRAITVSSMPWPIRWLPTIRPRPLTWAAQLSGWPRARIEAVNSVMSKWASTDPAAQRGRYLPVDAGRSGAAGRPPLDCG